MVIIVVIIIQCLVWHGALRRTAADADEAGHGHSEEEGEGGQESPDKPRSSLPRSLAILAFGRRDTGLHLQEGIAVKFTQQGR